MEHLLIECAVRGTLIAAGTAVVLWASRIKAPAVLHAIWTSVMLAMLLLPLWTIWGPQAAMPVLPRGQVSAGVATEVPAAPAASVSTPKRSAESARIDPPATTPASSLRWNATAAALGIYGAIACVLLVRLVIGTLRTRRLVRLAVTSAGRLTSAACKSPITVGWLRPVVILPESWREWSVAKLDAVITHEQAHLRRRDPLVQWLALLNRALFWFHPLAWWLERRLAALSEQACDDAVLARGHNPQDYSEYLLETARAVGRGARVNLAGVFMPGGFLSQRIRRILDGTQPARVSRTRIACAAVTWAVVSGLCAAAMPVSAYPPQVANLSSMVVRPVHPRWISPDSDLPQPVALPWIDGDEWSFEYQSILTDDELLSYGQLQTPRDRDAFIARFWASRDPTPETPENEFRSEYTRRVQFARDHFSDAGQGFGFDTDRGRIYLMFGSPNAIDTHAAGADPYEIWSYTSVADLGSDFRVRFPLSRSLYCGYRITSPAPPSTIGVTVPAPNVSAPLATVQLYALGLAVLSIRVPASDVTGVRWELQNRRGDQVDVGQVGSMTDRPSSPPLAELLPAAWLDAGLGCTHALPADHYTLTTTIRPIAGGSRSETTTFDIP